MRRALFLALLLSPSVSASEIEWDYEGFARLPEAAAEAQRKHRRLLVGLSGANT